MSKRVIHKWYADWCGPCKTVEPLLERLAEKFDCEIVYRNIEENAAEAKELGIRSIPSIFLYDGDELKVSRTGIGNTTEANLTEVFKTAYES